MVRKAKSTSSLKGIGHLVTASAVAFLLTASLSNKTAIADANETAVSPFVAVQSSISLANRNTCVVTNAGSAKCWGQRIQGEVGDGTEGMFSTDASSPTQVTGLTSGVIAVATGAEHACALLSSGSVQCWGRNNFGQIGDNSITNRSTPTQVSGLTSGVTRIAANGYATCALLTSGAVKCWGYNWSGGLGDGTEIDRLVPTTVSGLTSGVASISLGSNHGCALLDSGGLKCWGWNGYGRLGDGTTTARLTPVSVAGLTSGVSAVSAGDYQTCAVLTSGAVKCWGYNQFGQLGDGTTTQQTQPTQVSGLTADVISVSVGSLHVCALLNTGAAKCWGYNPYGALGNGTIANSLTPIDVTGLSTNVSAIAAGYYHTCAVLFTGSIKCWGLNTSGQLGDSSAVNRTSPVAVVGALTLPIPSTTTTTTTQAPTTTATLAPTTTTTLAPTTTTTSTTSTTTSTVAPTSSSSSTTSTTVPNTSSTAVPASTSTITSTVPTGMAALTPSSSLSASTLPSTTLPMAVVSPSTTTTTTSTTTTIPLSIGIANGNTDSIASAMSKDAARKTIAYVNGKKTSVKTSRTNSQITVTVAGTSTSLSVTAPDGRTIDIAADGILQTKPGGTVSTTTSGFATYSGVESWIYSTPLKLGTATTNGIGGATGSYKIPESISIGDHHLVIRGTNPQGQSVTIGFAMHIASRSSIIEKLIASPLTWILLLVFSIGALLLPARLRQRKHS